MRAIKVFGVICVLAGMAFLFWPRPAEDLIVIEQEEVVEPAPIVAAEPPTANAVAAEEPRMAAPDEEFIMEEPIIITETGDEELFHVVSLFFATNRALSADAPDPDDPTGQFTSDDGPLRYGIAEVSIPENHEVGALESQGFLEALFYEPDPEKHVILQRMDLFDVDIVLAEIQRQIDIGDDSTLFYIHGFNTSVETAARRAGQLTYDLNWNGPSFFFSWPSQENFLRYGVDKERARGSRTELLEVFETVAATETDQIVVIAHSMGTDLLAQTLELMEARDSAALAKIKTVILAAPDINEDNFRDDIVPAIDRIDDKYADFTVTVYASAGDTALNISEVTNSALRIGAMSTLTDEQRAALAPVRMVDASQAETNFFGHTYINDNATVIEDVYCLLLKGPDPAKRASLEGLPDPDDGPAFRIRPKVPNVALDGDGPGGQYQCD